MRFRRGYEDTRGAKVQGVKCRGACIVERHHIDVLLMGYTNRATSIIYGHNLLITQSYSPIEAGGCSLQFLPSDTICERSSLRRVRSNLRTFVEPNNPATTSCPSG